VTAFVGFERNFAIVLLEIHSAHTKMCAWMIGHRSLFSFRLLSAPTLPCALNHPSVQEVSPKGAKIQVHHESTEVVSEKKLLYFFSAWLMYFAYMYEN
jgi:hypothetical protein